MESDNGFPEDDLYVTPPYLKLYEGEEVRALIEAMFAENEPYSSDEETSEKGSRRRVLMLRASARHFATLRFFETIIGFHKGSLDLSGRHAHRYRDLMDRWNRFLIAFLIISPGISSSNQSDSETEEDENASEQLLPDDNEWRAFVKEWRLPECCDYFALLVQIGAVLNALAAHTTPKFQTFNIVDLPVELLFKIFDYASLEQARILSSTCRYLREVGRSFIFRDRELNMEANPTDEIDCSDSSEPLYQLALTARGKILDNIDFLISRPDLTSSLENLTVRNGWSRRMLRDTMARGFNLRKIDSDFYLPLETSLQKLFTTTANLTTVTFEGMTIVADLLRSVCDLRALRTVKYDLCVVPPFIQDLVADDVFPKSPTVQNLQFSFNENIHGTFSLWSLLYLYPEIRSLSICGAYGLLDILLPDPQFREICNIFQRLECLSFQYFPYEQLSAFHSWILAGTLNSTPPQLNLTHFKLHSTRGLWDHEISHLLDALQYAPFLEALSIDGILGLQTSLIDDIAAKLPNLLALVLIRRENYSQLTAQLCKWPQPSWEYAERLRAFRRLIFFGCNLHNNIWDSTPSVITQFEDGFPSNSASLKYKLSDDDSPKSYFQDDYLSAGPFAAYCPTLEVFAIFSSLPHLLVSISRSSKGTTLTPCSYATVENTLSRCRWLPGSIQRGWPPVLSNSRS